MSSYAGSRGSSSSRSSGSKLSVSIPFASSAALRSAAASWPSAARSAERMLGSPTSFEIAVSSIVTTPVPPADSKALPTERTHALRCRDSAARRSEEHTSELQSLMRYSYAVFCLKKKTPTNIAIHKNQIAYTAYMSNNTIYIQRYSQTHHMHSFNN